MTLEEAQSRLPQLISEMRPGEELHITRDERTIARLTVDAPELDKPREPGVVAGKLIVLSEDEDQW